MFLYYAGVRLGEIINITWEDLDFERGVIHLKIAKGENERVVFLHEKLTSFMEYFGMKKEGLIFLSNAGKKYNKRTIGVMVRNAAKKQALEKE